MSDPDLTRLREEIRAADRELLRLVARRLALARDIGERKRAQGAPIRNYEVEAEVIRLAEDSCRAAGLDPRVGRELFSVLIQEAIRVQERDRYAASRKAQRGEAALVLGGRGNMGRWFAQFLDSRGYAVTVADPAGALDGYPHEPDPYTRLDRYGLILVATPPSVVGEVLDRLAGARGLVVEIASLKSPFLPSMRRLLDGGLRVASVHPMWGPKTDLLAGRNVVVCSMGRPDLDEEARALFKDTAARLVTIPVEEHDPIMAYTLGLPHALNLAFTRALAQSPYGFSQLEPLGGPTFQKQAGVAEEVAGENRDLYHQIQKLNDHTPEMYVRMRDALAGLQAAVDDPAAFRRFMAECEAYYKAGKEAAR